MNELSKLMRDLRDERGLTQAELATRSGVSIPTIQRWETEGPKNARRRNLRDVFQALDEVAPIDAERSQAFIELTGIASIVQAVRDRMSSTAGVGKAALKIAAGVDSLTESEADCYRHLAALLNGLGAERVEPFLRAMLSTTGVEFDAAPKESKLAALRVAHPPRRDDDGFIVQEFTYYTREGNQLKPVPPGGRASTSKSHADTPKRKAK